MKRPLITVACVLALTIPAVGFAGNSGTAASTGPSLGSSSPTGTRPAPVMVRSVPSARTTTSPAAQTAARPALTTRRCAATGKATCPDLSSPPAVDAREPPAAAGAPWRSPSPEPSRAAAGDPPRLARAGSRCGESSGRPQPRRNLRREVRSDFDAEVGVESPQDWLARWPLKRWTEMQDQPASLPACRGRDSNPHAP